MSKAKVLEVQGTLVTVMPAKEGDHISLTDMLRAKDGDFFISDWLCNRNTVEFLGVWESIYNPAFNYGEFATIKSQAGLNSQGLPQPDRLQKLNEIAFSQMRSLLSHSHMKRLQS